MSVCALDFLFFRVAGKFDLLLFVGFPLQQLINMIYFICCNCGIRNVYR